MANTSSTIRVDIKPRIEKIVFIKETLKNKGFFKPM
jgi:hypothetical protein